MKAIAVGLIVAMMAGCGGGSDPASSVAAQSAGGTSSASSGGSDPGSVGSGSAAPAQTTPAPASPSTPAPVVPAAPAASVYEGIWSGPSTVTGNPGLIVDADGIYYLEDVGWIDGGFYPAAAVGNLGGLTVDQFAASRAGSDHGQDDLTLSAANLSAGTLTLLGSLTGTCTPDSGSYDCFPAQAFPAPNYDGTWAWSDQLSPTVSPKPTPIASLAGTYTTTWAGTLTIAMDGSFTLTDLGTGSLEPSNCLYTGQITLKDPNVAVYSVTATASLLPNTGIPCRDTADPVTGVFTLVNGQLVGGMANAKTGTVLDTMGS